MAFRVDTMSRSQCRRKLVRLLVRNSSIRTDMPFCSLASANAIPTGPAPTMQTSNWGMVPWRAKESQHVKMGSICIVKLIDRRRSHGIAAAS